MAYKKYIKRGGKVYGPYIYHSKRVDGKVVSEYRGTHSKKIDYKKFLWIGLGILVISLLAFGVSFLGKGSISGKTVFELIYSEDNQTVLIQDQQGNNIVSLQFLNSLESIGLGREIIEVRVESYLPYNLDFTLDNITYFHKGGRISRIFRNGDVKEKIINGSQESWKNLSQLELLAGEEKILKMDFSELNLILSTEEKNIDLGYNNQKITFLLDNLTEGKISVEIKSINETLNQILNQKIVVLSGIDLTEAERAILINEFGEENIKKIRSEIDNGRLKIGYKLREYKIEYSYDDPMDEKIRELQMEADRTKWLKNIAATLLRKASVPQQKDTGEDSFPID